MSWHSVLKPKSFLWLVPLFLLIEIYSVLPKRPLQTPTSVAVRPFARGVYHLHSRFSHDAVGTIEEIALAAADKGLDFAIVTDHNTLEAHRLGLDKRYGSVDIFVETEASLSVGHAVSFVSHTEAGGLSDSALIARTQEQLERKSTVADKSFQVIAHPTNRKRPWDRMDLMGDGMEVVNLDSVWREHFSSSLGSALITGLLYPLNPYLAMLRLMQVNPKNFQIWDHMNSVSRNHFGLLGHDTHAHIRITGNMGIAWPGYGDTFKLASNIVFLDEDLPDDFVSRRARLYQQIRAGRLAIVFDYIHPFNGNDWRIECEGDSVASGQHVPLSENGCRSVVQTPENFPFALRVKLIRNGREVLADDAGNVRLTEAGTYRVEVWALPKSRFSLLLNEPVPYLFYNPIYVD